MYTVPAYEWPVVGHPTLSGVSPAPAVAWLCQLVLVQTSPSTQQSWLHIPYMYIWESVETSYSHHQVHRPVLT